MGSEALSVDIVEVHGFPQAAVVLLQGPVNAETVGALRKVVWDARERGVHWFALEMSGVPYVNSTGISFLTKFSDEVLMEGSALALAGLQAKVRDVMKMMDLLQFFRVCENVEAAVRQFRMDAGVPEPPPPPPEPPPRGCLGALFGRKR